MLPNQHVNHGLGNLNDLNDWGEKKTWARSDLFRRKAGNAAIEKALFQNCEVLTTLTSCQNLWILRKWLRLTDPVRGQNRGAAHLKKEKTENTEATLMDKVISQGDNKRTWVWRRLSSHAYASMRIPSCRLTHESKLWAKYESLDCPVPLRTRE